MVKKEPKGKKKKTRTKLQKIELPFVKTAKESQRILLLGGSANDRKALAIVVSSRTIGCELKIVYAGRRNAKEIKKDLFGDNFRDNLEFLKNAVPEQLHTSSAAAYKNIETTNIYFNKSDVSKGFQTVFRNKPLPITTYNGNGYIEQVQPREENEQRADQSPVLNIFLKYRALFLESAVCDSNDRIEVYHELYNLLANNRQHLGMFIICVADAEELERLPGEFVKMFDIIDLSEDEVAVKSRKAKWSKVSDNQFCSVYRKAKKKVEEQKGPKYKLDDVFTKMEEIFVNNHMIKTTKNTVEKKYYERNKCN